MSVTSWRWAKDELTAQAGTSCQPSIGLTATMVLKKLMTDSRPRVKVMETMLMAVDDVEVV